MNKKLIFTLLWMGAGLVAAAIISLLIAPLVPRPPAADEHTSTVMIFIYIGFALMPWVGLGIPLILGLLGKLPGTKKDVSK